jgi:cyclophilin family peptidyl-prolyl cis-trans isomerase
MRIPGLLILTLTILVYSCTKKTPEKAMIKSGKTKELKMDNEGISKMTATIKTVHGNIVLKFFPKDAPNTVTRITELMKSGFYDGLVFHRVVPNFVIQGGDPTGTGAGGSGVKLKAEFNQRPHIKGTLAMARSQDVDSADSQFYIALSTIPHLDGSYTVFGKVIEGLDLLEKIQQGDKMLSINVEENPGEETSNMNDVVEDSEEEKTSDDEEQVTE